MTCYITLPSLPFSAYNVCCIMSRNKQWKDIPNSLCYVQMKSNAKISTLEITVKSPKVGTNSSGLMECPLILTISNTRCSYLKESMDGSHFAPCWGKIFSRKC